MNGVYDGPDFEAKLTRRRKVTPEQITEMVGLYQACWTLARLAERYGVTPSAIHYQVSQRVVTRGYDWRKKKGAA